MITFAAASTTICLKYFCTFKAKKSDLDQEKQFRIKDLIS